MSLSTPLLAEDEDIERVVVTANRTPTSLSSLPHSISTVDEDVLTLIAPVHIEEVLKTVAGANFHRGNGQEYLPALRSGVLSGAGACGGILTLENGIPLRAPGFCNINELFEAHTEIAAGIEVIKGPASAHYGSNAVHGVVNVITPQAGAPSYFTLDGGSFGYTRARMQHGVDLDDAKLSAGLSVTRDTGYREQESVDMQKLTLNYADSVGNWDVEHGATYVNLDQETASFVEGFEAYRDRFLSQQNDDPEAFRDGETLRIFSRWQNQVSDNTLVQITPFFRDQSMIFRMHFLPGTPFEENAQTGVGLQSQVVHQWQPNVRLRIGFDADATRGELAQFQPDPTAGSPFLQATIPQGQHYDYVVDAIQLVPFVQVEWQWNQAQFQFGVRTEYNRYDYDNRMLSGRTRDDGTDCGFGGFRYSRPEDRTDSFTATSPKFGVVYTLSEQSRWFANISRGYRAPQATELYRLQRQQQVADLDSESVTSGEVGYGYEGRESRLLLAAYAMKKTNVIFRDSSFFNVSGGETRHRGLEVEGQLQLTPTLSTSVAATYAIHEYANDRLIGDSNIRHNAIDSAPRWVGNWQVNWQILPSLLANAELHWVSRYYTDPENLNEYDGHELVNLRAVWNATRDWDVTFRIMNALDTRYAERADFTVFSGDRYFPGEPRSYWVSAQYHF